MFSFLTSDSNVVIAADRKSIETICFIKDVEAECVSENVELGDYGHSITEEVACIKGCFLKKVADSANGQIFRISKKVTIFYKESILSCTYVSTSQNQRKARFSLFFESTVVKIYSFTTLCWIDEDENK